jgi:hypothetical protein
LSILAILDSGVEVSNCEEGLEGTLLVADVSVGVESGNERRLGLVEFSVVGFTKLSLLLSLSSWYSDVQESQSPSVIEYSSSVNTPRFVGVFPPDKFSKNVDPGLNGDPKLVAASESMTSPCTIGLVERVRERKEEGTVRGGTVSSKGWCLYSVTILVRDNQELRMSRWWEGKKSYTNTKKQVHDESVTKYHGGWNGMEHCK